MNQPDHIQAELATLAPTLAAMPRTMPYEVPAGYFEGLESIIVEQALLHEPVQALPDSGVPEGYFEQLPALLLVKIRNQEHELELQSIAPVLAGIPRDMPFHLPAGYFKSLDPAAALQPAPAKAGILRQIGRSGLWRAAAAAVLLVAIFSIWKMSNRTPTAEPTLAVAPADSATINRSLSAVDDTLLVSYFAELGIAEEASTMTIYMDTTSIEETLASFTEEELQSQLQELPLVEAGI
ncbi:MAG: hypothetical protein MUF29_05365 [Chitinophagaceae bacterium]|nr:hypothetical protein [Chitinophagaceae bacterium]